MGYNTYPNRCPTIETKPCIFYLTCTALCVKVTLQPPREPLTDRKSLYARVRNWGALKKTKMQLLESVKKTRGAGRGVDIPLLDRADPERVPILVSALEAILVEHPELQVLVGPKNLTLGYRQDFAGAIAAQLREQLEIGGFIARPGEELPTEETTGHAEPADITTLYSQEELNTMSESQLAAVQRGERLEALRDKTSGRIIIVDR